MKALIVGPGRIGCGFAGQLLQASGYDIVFVSRNPVMNDYLERVAGYRVRLVSRTMESQEVTVDGVRSICTNNTKQVIKEISEARL